jgi:hypothetical protein
MYKLIVCVYCLVIYVNLRIYAIKTRHIYIRMDMLFNFMFVEAFSRYSYALNFIITPSSKVDNPSAVLFIVD